MWQSYKLYLLALIIYTVATVALAVLELAAIRYAEAAILARWATMLSGGFLGGFALVLGILRDDRVEKERQRAEKAEAAIAEVQKRVDQERSRADRAEAELLRVRAEYSLETVARLRRLEAAVGIAPAEVADDDRSSRPMEQ